MKQLAINSLTSLITGICFAGGLILAGILASHFYNDKSSFPELQYTNFPAGLIVIRHSVVQGRPSFTIRGSVKNTSSETWQRVSLIVDIRAGDALVNQCENDIRGEFLPDTERAFEIECYRVSGSNLPDNVSYHVAVKSAGKGA
nr:putative integron gene cassette protein [uncultured bacterium]